MAFINNRTVFAANLYGKSLLYITVENFNPYFSMKRYIAFVLLLFSLQSMGQSTQNFYSFLVDDIHGKPYDLASLKGKKVLVVNTASKCGLTPQYSDLEKLYQQYKDQNFIIIGFPANNFLRQEPGSNNEINQFCTNYGVTFPMMAKISVKGIDMHPLYQWLTQREKNGVQDAEVQWNFQKFLIDEEGRWAGVVSPKTNPFDQKIIGWIEKK